MSGLVSGQCSSCKYVQVVIFLKFLPKAAGELTSVLQRGHTKCGERCIVAVVGATEDDAIQ